MLARRLLFLAALPLLARAEKPYDFLVQGALDSELQPLVKALAGRRELKIESWTFWTGRIGRNRVVVSRTEMGPLNATMATTFGIRRFHPKAIINQGTAGAHNPDLKLWDIVVGEKTTDYGAYRSDHGDPGTGIQPVRWKQISHRIRGTPYPSFPGDSKLIDSAIATPYARGKVVRGNVGTAFQFNKELDYIAAVRKLFGTDSEDMESAYVAGAAQALNTPFVAIRIISDSEWNHPTFEKVAGEYCAEFVVEMLRRSGGSR